MKNFAMMDLQLFAEEAAAPAAGAADTGTAAEISTNGTGDFNVGDQMADGTRVESARIAAALNSQMKRHPDLRNVYRRGQTAQAAPTQAGQQPAQAGNQTAGEPTLEDRWNELKKGEFKDLYAQDVKNTISERFKNQEDATKKLESLNPMLNALMKKAGVDNWDDLSKMILDDDSLYEEDAEKMGMPVEQYKQYKKIQDENEALRAREAQSLQEQQQREHYMQLIQQSAELKQKYPNFDLMKEYENPHFRRLTNSGVSVEQAYFAIHMNELAPQLMAYGMQQGQQQMSQNIQARGARPAEGAMGKGPQASAEMQINFKGMTRKQRDEIRRQVHSGKVGNFD